MSEVIGNHKGEGNYWYKLVERYEKEEEEKLNKELNSMEDFEREEHHLEMMAEAYDRSQTRGVSLEEAMKEVEAEEEVKDKARLLDANMILPFPEREDHHIEIISESFEKSQTEGVSLEEAIKEVETEEKAENRAKLLDAKIMLFKDLYHYPICNDPTSENSYGVQPLKAQENLKHHPENYTIEEIYEACNRLGTKPALKQEAFDSESKSVHKKRVKKPKKPGSLLDKNVLSS